MHYDHGTIYSEIIDLRTGVMENARMKPHNHKTKHLTKELQDKDRIINISITKLSEMIKKL